MRSGRSMGMVLLRCMVCFIRWEGADMPTGSCLLYVYIRVLPPESGINPLTDPGKLPGAHGHLARDDPDAYNGDGEADDGQADVEGY